MGSGGDDTTASAVGAARAVHRWRDLDRAARLWSLAVVVALLLAPAMAIVHFGGHWRPQADPALMALRSLDVGTARTPMLGQPSQSSAYADSISPVHHPGPWHFYLMALPVRVLGATAGMLLVSVLLTGGTLVAAAWAVFRQLGRTAGVVAAVALGAVAFTTGASSLINPVSSSIAGYPLLLSAVLLWCVSCGDLRLLPAATGAVSFTAQQHLSVVPATAVVTAGALALCGLSLRRSGARHDRAARREIGRWVGLSGAVAFVLWLPLLAQQAFGAEGNLGQILWFATHDDHAQLGYRSAAWQVAHALGLPPVLGRTEVDGRWLISRPGVGTWLTAGLVLAVVVGLCVRWRRERPRQASLGPMIGVVVAAGLVNGASVPTGLEQARLSFYHWVWVLSFFVALVLGLGLAEAVRSRVGAPTGGPVGALAGRRAPAAGRAVMAGAVVAIALPSLVNPALDRFTNTDAAAYTSLPATAIDQLADAGADGVAGADHPLLLSRNEPAYLMYRETLALALVERGVDIRMPATTRFFVHDDRLVDDARVDGGLVLVVDREMPEDAPPGALVARVDLPGTVDLPTYRAMVATARRADELRLGDAVDAGLRPDQVDFVVGALSTLVSDPEAALLDPDLLAYLAAHPPLAEPALDPDDAAALLASIEATEGWTPGAPTALRLYQLDRSEVLDEATDPELGRRPDG